MRWAVLLVVSSLFLVSCSKRETTVNLGQQVAEKFAELPATMRSVQDEESAEAAVQKIQSITQSVIQIVEQVDVDEPLTTEERLNIEKQLRDTQDEVEYLFTQLSQKPALVVKISEPIAELGEALEFASSAMNQQN